MDCKCVCVLFLNFVPCMCCLAAATALDELLRRVAEERKAEEKRRGSLIRSVFVVLLAS